MLNKIVVIEPTGLTKSGKEELASYASEIIFYDTIPSSDEEIIERMKDADAVFLFTTTTIKKEHIEACPKLKYIGMCCSLYSKESANVDIDAANELGVSVTGIRDYGDEGVVEFVISELVRYLHGFGPKQWKDQPVEITNLKVGIVGLGTTGIMIANALNYFGADISYYSRTRKKDYEDLGYNYREFHDLLKEVDVVFSCLNKNVILFGEEEFKLLGDHKIFFNTSIGPGHEPAALYNWLESGTNEFFCDSTNAIGDVDGKLIDHPHVNCMNKSAGLSMQAYDRLSEKVLDNFKDFLSNK